MRLLRSIKGALVNLIQVPLYFGPASSRTVSVLGERQTHIRCLSGWGDRIATMVLTISADGTLVSPVVLIFKGKGKQVNAEELRAYALLPNTLILWQKKAWIDSEKEMEVMKRVIVPYAGQLQTEYGANTEVLLTEDRGPGHDHVCAKVHCLTSPISPRTVVEFAKKNKVFIAMTPSDTTWALQAIDDNVGKSFRSDVEVDLEENVLMTYDFVSNPKGTMTLSDKRIAVAQAAQRTFIKWQSSTERKALILKSAIRTGLRMEIDSNYDIIRPVRYAALFLPSISYRCSFPETFGLSILPAHPLSSFVKPYYPVVPLDPFVTATATGDAATATAMGTVASAIAETGRAVARATGTRASVSASSRGLASSATASVETSTHSAVHGVYSNCHFQSPSPIGRSSFN